MRFFAASPPSAATQAMEMVPSSSISMVVPVSSWMPRITTPPLPMTSRILSGLIFILMMRGAKLESSAREPSIACFMICRIIRRASRAWSSATFMMPLLIDQAREARLMILQIMKQAIEGSRAELSSFAPRIIKMKINPDKIRDVIGKGGVVIRGIQEETGTTIEIEDDGTIAIACVSAEGGEAAKKRIQELTADVEVGKIYEGTVLRLLDFGAIVQLLPGRDGLLHISQISHERVNAVSDHLKEGQVVKVKVLEADDKGRVRLSMKAISAQETAKTNG